MLFSQRYHRALNDGRLRVEFSDAARPKLSKCLSQFDTSYGVKRDPNDNWISNSSIEEEAVRHLMIEHGWDSISSTDAVAHGDYSKAFDHIVLRHPAPIVFDLIELSMSFMDSSQRENCRGKINSIFDLHDCAWRITDGEFFKLDSDFVGIRLAAEAHDNLTANKFVGAANEYAKARQELALNDVKDSIIQASKSFESVMKVITGLEHANADGLIKAMLSQGYFDDLPETVRAGFAEQVMKTLPFLRNKLAGHGQGTQVVEVSKPYGELAVQLAATFHNFLVSKYLQRNPSAPQTTKRNLRNEIAGLMMIFHFSKLLKENHSHCLPKKDIGKAKARNPLLERFLLRCLQENAAHPSIIWTKIFAITDPQLQLEFVLLIDLIQQVRGPPLLAEARTPRGDP